MLKEGRAEIEQRVKSGEIQPAIVTGGAAFTDAAWSRILECMDANLEAVKEEHHAITMFSPSDIRRIMETIATDAKCEQIALLLKDKERDEVI